MTVAVRRSALKMWLMAMGGIPLLVISIDVLTQRRITRWLTDIVFEPEDVQIFEPRDVIFAWAMLLFGALFVIWGLKELFVPTKVVECTEDGLAIRLNGPHRGPSLIPWDNIRDVGGADIDDDGDMIPLLILTVFDRSELPNNPWGARWVTELELGIMAQDFDDDPHAIAELIAEYAVDRATPGRHQRAANIPEEP
ncbi:MAG TPA: hypothetical protein VK969_10125 [Acidimicrobiia bacterium]|nr:hypothetical protein [Acidimicrobiia bacterium]